VEWRNARFGDTSRPGIGNFEVLLYEGSSDWAFQYRIANGDFIDGAFGYAGLNDTQAINGVPWVCNPQSVTAPNYANINYTGPGVAVRFTRPLLTPTVTNTPTITSTPTRTFTPTNTPTITSTPTRTPYPSCTPDWDYTFDTANGVQLVPATAL